MIENIAQTTRNILSNNKYDNHEEDSILLMAVTAAKIKPVSCFGVKDKNKKTQSENAKKLGLKYQITNDSNKQGFYEMVVGSKRSIAKYNNIDNNITERDERQRALGEILGYPITAVDEFIASTNQKRAIKFWHDIVNGKTICSELIIAMQIGQLVPPSYNDKKTINYGDKIKKLLDKIDPKIAQKYIEIGKRTLFAEAKNAIKDWERARP